MRLEATAGSAGRLRETTRNPLASTMRIWGEPHRLAGRDRVGLTETAHDAICSGLTGSHHPLEHLPFGAS
ncbi:hypothetical protein [Streptomyces vastus]|uniref:Uncharacterized protein n=1 Tax=Streptomyces vastus TaxID=285451 RepID=A0ABN3R787_9ACTN